MARGWLATQTVDSGEESQGESKPVPKGPLAKKFSPNRQTGRLFLSQGWRVLLTGIFAACVVFTLKIYENQGNLSHRSKNTLNTILTALSLALGLNFFDAFKDMARVLRWRLLADRPFSVRELDLILGGDSVTKPLRLLWESPTKPIIFFTCLLWILMNVAAQVAVAIISLTYSMDNGLNSKGTYNIPGTVLAAKMDCFYSSAGCSEAPESNMTIAHNYGMVTHGTIRCNYTNDAEINSTAQLCNYFRRTDGSDFAFQFRELNPEDRTRGYPYFTNRTIRASAGRCIEYETDDGSTTDTPDGKEDGWIWPFHNQTYNDTLPIPRFDAAYDATTYVYNGTAKPQDAVAMACGPRCIRMYAFRSFGVRSPRKNTIFSCPITLSEVNNATLPAHRIPDDVARIAIASVALSGRYTTPLGSKDQDWRQYQMYPWGNDWETNDLTAQEVGERMAEFTIGTIAGLTQYNPMQPIQGTLPILGYNLSIQWRYLIPLIVGIALAHAILFLSTILIARPIVVLDDSNLSTARVLQELMRPLKGQGSLLDGEEMAKAIQEGVGPGGKVVYGLQSEGQGGQEMLGVGTNIRIRRRLRGKRFPQGLYT